ARLQRAGRVQGGHHTDAARHDAGAAADAAQAPAGRLCGGDSEAGADLVGRAEVAIQALVPAPLRDAVVRREIREPSNFSKIEVKNIVCTTEPPPHSATTAEFQNEPPDEGIHPGGEVAHLFAQPQVIAEPQELLLETRPAPAREQLPRPLEFRGE